MQKMKISPLWLELVIAFLVLFIIGIGAALSHDSYTGWRNQESKLCCNKEDCKPIESRFTNRRTEVLIEGQWCPVLPKHYRSDNMGPHPEWASPHACVCKGSTCVYFNVSANASPCERLVCYEPPGAGS